MATKKTKTKTLTSKQAVIKIDKLLRGVDNSVAQIEKHSKNIQESVPVMREFFTGLTNPPEITGTKSKSETKSKKTKSKPKPKIIAKAKPVTKAKAKSKTKPVIKANNDVKAPVPGRPALKQAIQEVFNGNSKLLAASEIWKIVTNKYGYWSRQSVYNTLKKHPRSFKKDGDKFQLILQEDENVEKFVDSVGKDQSVADVI